MKRKDGGMLQCQSSFIKINFYVLTEYIIKISFKIIIFSVKSRHPSPLACTRPSHGENLQLLTAVLTNLNRDCRRLAPPSSSEFVNIEFLRCDNVNYGFLGETQSLDAASNCTIAHRTFANRIEDEISGKLSQIE